MVCVPDGLRVIVGNAPTGLTNSINRSMGTCVMTSPLVLFTASTMICAGHRSPATGAPKPQFPPVSAVWISVVFHVTRPVGLIVNPGGCALGVPPGAYVIPDGQGTDVIPLTSAGPKSSAKVDRLKIRVAFGSMSVTAEARLNVTVGCRGTARIAGTEATGDPLG